MGTTPIYSLAYPDFSDNVADGATAIQTLATGVESMLDVYAGLKKIVPTPTGHTNITFDSRGNGTPSLVTSFTITNIFSSEFNAYRFHWTGFRRQVSPTIVSLQFPNITTNVYQYGLVYGTTGSSSVTGTSSTNVTTAQQVGYVLTTGALCAVDIYNPAIAARKHFVSPYVAPAVMGMSRTVVDSTTIATGLTVNISSVPTQAGTVSIYGYNV